MLRAGTVGVGRLGREHVRVLAGLPGVKLAGVYDKNAERGRHEAERHGTSQRASLEELIENCDLITVAAPTSAHFEIASRILEAGVACFVEKPICAESSEAEALVALAARRGLPLGVGHIERYNPAVTALRGLGVRPRFIEAHRLGQFTPRGTDVSVVYDLMIHDIDLLLSLVDEEPADIRAAGAAVVSDDLDICNARLEFASGVVANLTASRISTFTMRRFRIFAEETYLVLDLRARTLEHYRLFESDEAARAADPASARQPLGDRGQIVTVRKTDGAGPEMLKAELEDFVRAVRAGEEPPVRGADGLRALRLAEGIRLQAHALLKRAHLV